jgi:selenocysteine lyase/cysteine desulfurase
MTGLNEVITWFLSLGVENIYNHIIEIQEKFIELLDKSKYRIESDTNPEHRSNILIFTHADQTKNAAIQKALAEENIYIAIREGYLRLSPHIYNNFDDVEILTKELNSL